MSDPIKTERKVPRHAAFFNAQSGATSVEDDRFTLTPFAGQVFDHWYWGKMTFDADGLSMRKSVIPAFKDHDPANLVGEIDTLKVKDGAVELSGSFLDTPAAKEIRSTQKMEWECSLAFDLPRAVIEEVGKDQSAEVNGAKVKGPITIFRKADLYETSFTFFGAVPGTQTAFAEGGETCVSIFSHFSKEIPMSDSTREDILAEGRKESLSLFNQMTAICDDKVFVAEKFAAGVSFEQFQRELLAKQSAELNALRVENASLTEQLAKAVKVDDGDDGAAPASFSEGKAPAKKEEDLDFVALAKKLAKDESITFSAALSRIARENPEAYQKYNPSAVIGGQK